MDAQKGFDGGEDCSEVFFSGEGVGRRGAGDGAEFEVADAVGQEVVQDGLCGVGEAVEVVAELVDGFGEDGEETVSRLSGSSSSWVMAWARCCTSEESSRLFPVASLPGDPRRRSRGSRLSSSARSHGDIGG
jgi:hypothetical protein